MSKSRSSKFIDLWTPRWELKVMVPASATIDEKLQACRAIREYMDLLLREGDYTPKADAVDPSADSNTGNPSTRDKTSSVSEWTREGKPL